MAPINERRRWPRVNVHWQVLFCDRDAELLECTTHNISSGGFYVRIERLFRLGENLDCVLCIPSHGSRQREERVRIHCRVESVRVDDAVDGRIGTAFRILDYQVEQHGVSE